jgi:hypothetical protein
MIIIKISANNLWVRIKTLDRSKPWPEGRYFHSAIAYKNSIILFGGQGERQTFDSTWAFDTDTKEWSKWDCTSFYSAEENKIATRYKHTATLYNDLMIVCGGKESKAVLVFTIPFLPTRQNQPSPF